MISFLLTFICVIFKFNCVDIVMLVSLYFGYICLMGSINEDMLIISQAVGKTTYHVLHRNGEQGPS